MNRLLLGSLALVAVLFTGAARADVLVLVHGYAADSSSWEFSGVNSQLAANGWQRAGIFTPTPAGLRYIPGPGAADANKVFSVNLPAQAPLAVQADLLRSVLAVIRQQNVDEALILAGHSAGGVVARMALLGGNPYQVSTLITIASPNLGTVRAAQGLDIVDAKPFFCPGPGIDFLKSVVGGSDYDYLDDSRAVLIDLLPQGSGNVLTWMNQQPYPDIRYYSVIRQTPVFDGDAIVPAFSQDLNNVPSLRGKSEVIIAPTGHSLVADDGVLIAGILNRH